MRIVITGPKCAGKSSVARRLAELACLELIETDNLIERIYQERFGKNLNCRGIYREHGEDFFRALEREAVRECEDVDWLIISTGGYTLMDPENRSILRDESVLILLYADPAVLWERMQNYTGIAPFLEGPEGKAYFFERTNKILDVLAPYCDIKFDTSLYSMDEIDKIAEKLLERLACEFAIRSRSPNTIGSVLRVMTFGESHGSAIGAVVDGLPAGIPISKEDIQKHLDRRRPGQSRITTPRNESDEVKILSGVFEGKTTGAPIALIIENKDVDSSKYDSIKELFRPGHADFTFWAKYGHRDYRGGGRSSGRETAARVAAGAVAIEELKRRGIDIIAYTLKIGDIVAKNIDYSKIETNPVRTADPYAAELMEKKILEVKAEGDSIGGMIQLEIKGVPAGLGDPVFYKLDARLAAAILSLGAVKGIEFGAGFKVAEMKGSENNDQMQDGRFLTNNAGGILGGISTGEDIVVRIAVKPTPSILKEQKTIDIYGKNRTIRIEGRHDPCIVPRLVPVVEAMAAIVILDALLIQERLKKIKGNKG